MGSHNLRTNGSGHCTGARVNAADLLIDTPAHEAEVEGHEVAEQPFFRVGDVAALAYAVGIALGVNHFVDRRVGRSGERCRGKRR